LAERIRELTEEEFVQIARVLICKSERDIFGDTEFEVRDILIRAGAKAFEEHLRQKKTATRDAVSTARAASKPPSSRGIDPSPP
jgi:hypothetical protein